MPFPICLCQLAFPDLPFPTCLSQLAFYNMQCRLLNPFLPRAPAPPPKPCCAPAAPRSNPLFHHWRHEDELEELPADGNGLQQQQLQRLPDLKQHPQHCSAAAVAAGAVNGSVGSGNGSGNGNGRTAGSGGARVSSSNNGSCGSTSAFAPLARGASMLLPPLPETPHDMQPDGNGLGAGSQRLPTADESTAPADQWPPQHLWPGGKGPTAGGGGYGSYSLGGGGAAALVTATAEPASEPASCADAAVSSATADAAAAGTLNANSSRSSAPAAVGSSSTASTTKATGGGGSSSPITSVYFDNADLQVYHQRLVRGDGASLVRIRWVVWCWLWRSGAAAGGLLLVVAVWCRC